MKADEAWLAVAVVVVLLTAGQALSGPWGLLPYLVPREWRARFRGRRRWIIVGGQVRRGRQRSARVSKRLERIVMAADRERCVYCRRRAGDWDSAKRRRVRLAVDHMVPWRLGGITCAWNCAVLCSEHNGVKAAYFRRPDGSVYYRPGVWRTRDRAEAARILGAERAARWSPLRLGRALLALAA